MEIILSENEKYTLKLPERVNKNELMVLMEKLATISQLSVNSFVEPVKREVSPALSFLRSEEETKQILDRWNNGTIEDRKNLAKKYNKTYANFYKSLQYVRTKQGNAKSSRNPRSNSPPVKLATSGEYHKLHNEWVNASPQGKEDISRRYGKTKENMNQILWLAKKKFVTQNGN